MENQRYCQSCGMPMTGEKLLGTNANGSKNEEYCVYCYQNGKFTVDCSMEEMIEHCVPYVLKEGVYADAAIAQKALQEYYPSLKRWRKV